MSWYPLPVTQPYLGVPAAASTSTSAAGAAPSPAAPFGYLPPALPMANAYGGHMYQQMYPQAAPHAASSAPLLGGHKRPFDSASSAAGASGSSAAAADGSGHKFARSADGRPMRGGRGGGRGGGGRGGGRGGARMREPDSASTADAAAAAAVPCTPGFLPDGRPDLSMYLTPAHAQPAAPAPPPPPPAPTGPTYCQKFMHNLCQLRSCDAESDTEEEGSEGEGEGKSLSLSSSRRRIPRCSFLHDDDFRRVYLARSQFRQTAWLQAHKEQPHPMTRGMKGHGAAAKRRGQQATDEEAPKDGKLAGLKAPVKENALLRKLLASELRVESSRALQAIRHIVSQQCFKPQRQRIRQQQRKAMEEYERSKKEEQEREKQEGEEQNKDTQQSTEQETEHPQPSAAESSLPTSA